MKKPSEVKPNIKEKERQIVMEHKASICCGSTCCGGANETKNKNREEN